MKIFYTIAGLWLLSLFIGESSSELNARFRDATFLIIMIITLAVYAIDSRIESAIKEIKEPGYNKRSERLKDWFEYSRFIAAIIGIFVLGTLAQGTMRCVTSGNEFSVSCVWAGVTNQLNEDIGLE